MTNDILQTEQTKAKAGEWVDEIGERVFFDDIKENEYYIRDYSTYYHKRYKVIYVKWKKDDFVGYIVDERFINCEWCLSNFCSASTRKMYVDREPNKGAGMADTSGWWYQVPKMMTGR